MRRYSLIAIVLHWTIAAAIAFQISVGWALEALGARGFSLYQWHKSVGITVLVLTLLRIVVRYWKPRPEPTEGGWEGALAKAVHAGLYAFMLAAPLTGWALVSTAKVKVPTLLFGTIPLPHLPLPATMHDGAQGAHGLLAFLFLALFLLHVVGALRHQLLLRDGLMWRMVPGRSIALLWLLPLLVPAGIVLGKAILPGPVTPAPARSVAPDAPEDDVPEAVTPAPAPEAIDNAANAIVESEEPTAPPPAWIVQPGGRIGFAVGNGSETITGSFSRWTARIVMDPDHPQTADIRVEIDLASASVGDAYQNGMLPGDEFFATAAHPTATFSASGADHAANGYRAVGTLTLKGVRKAQTIRFTLSGSGRSRTVSGSARVARMDFGVGNGASSSDLAPIVRVDFRFLATRAD
jgi:cytochrome b561/polyisoprenoid-binding protein YceI